MYKIYTQESIFIADIKNLEEAKKVAKIRKTETKKDYYIKTDGIKIWDTTEGDNNNIKFL